MTSDQWQTLDPRRRYPDAPVIDDESDAVLTGAVNDLILLRSPMWHGDSGALLHTLASLRDQIADWLPDAIADARDQDYDWTEIGQLLGLSASTVQRVHAKRTCRRVPLDID